MKKFYLTLFTFTLIFPLVNGQYSNRQAGLRIGYRGGIYYQVTREAGNAEIGYNAMLGFSNQGVQLTGLRIVYEKSLSRITPELFFAWGYGGHVGFGYAERTEYYGDPDGFYRKQFCPVIGADGWLAAEYRFEDVPLILSLNLKPFIELAIPSYVRFMPADLGLSISYVF
jgi:hypothetical protein